MGRGESELRDRVIFILGLPRSGTYWLQRIVAAHPDVTAMPNETHLFSRVIAPATEHFHHGARSSPSLNTIYVDRELLIDRLRDLCDAVLAAHIESGARMLAERSPWHVLHVGLMAEIYPDARFIHIIRDPRAVARSQLGHDWGPGSAEDAARKWAEGIRSARAASAPHYLELRYEDLLDDTAPQIRAIYDWLGLDTGAGRLEAAVDEARVHVNVDPKGTEIGSRKWERELPAETIDAIERAAGDLLAALGYEPSRGPAQEERAEADRRPLRDGAELPAGALRRALGRLRLRRRPGPAGRGDPGSAVQVFDEFVTRVHGASPDRAAELLIPGATVRLVRDGEDLLRAGEEGRRALTEAVAADPVFRERQVGSRVLATFPTTVGLLAYESEDGRVARRIIIVEAHHDRVANVIVEWIPDSAV